MTTYTEKELREHKRAAFEYGADFGHRSSGPYSEWDAIRRAAVIEAKLKYPEPFVTRPRVVRVTDAARRLVEIKIECGRLYHRFGAMEPWLPSAHNRITAQAVLDLYNNPTETVPA